MENGIEPFKVVICMYLHRIELTIDKVTPENAAEFIDSETLSDNAVSDITEQIKYDVEEGVFEGSMYFNLSDDEYCETLVELSGSWRILPNLEAIRRVLRWRWNHDHDNGLSPELFEEYFGEQMGSHYYEKWRWTFGQDLMRMFEYYGENTTEAMKFLEMLMSRVREHEKRCGIV